MLDAGIGIQISSPLAGTVTPILSTSMVNIGTGISIVSIGVDPVMVSLELAAVRPLEQMPGEFRSIPFGGGERR